MKRVLILSFVLFIWLRTAAAQPDELSVEQQISMLVKVLSFDKNVPLEKKDFLIGILYQNGHSASDIVRASIMSLNDTSDLVLSSGNRVRFIPIDFDGEGRWRNAIDERAISSVIVTPIERTNIPLISSFCRERHIISMTTVADYVEDGISLGIGSSNGKLLILVNLPVSIEEGAKLSSRVLQIAKIYR